MKFFKNNKPDSFIKKDKWDMTKKIIGKKPTWNVIIRIIREVDYNVEELDTYGKMYLDILTGTVRLVSKEYNVDEPAISYRYFKPCGGYRIIYLYNPFPGVFRPIDYELNTIKGKQVKRGGKEGTDEECIYCRHDTETKQKTTTLTINEYIVQKITKDNEIHICSKHNSTLIKARFKVIPEEKKEWYAQRQNIRERRKLSEQMRWWQSPLANIALMGMIFIIFVIVLFQFAPTFMGSMMDKVADKLATRMIDINAPRP
jgi:hypothetical protein